MSINIILSKYIYAYATIYVTIYIPIYHIPYTIYTTTYILYILMYYALTCLSPQSLDLLLGTLCTSRVLPKLHYHKVSILYTIYIYMLLRLFVCILVRIFRLLSHCFHFEINNALSCASCSININQRPFVSSHSTPGQSRGECAMGAQCCWAGLEGTQVFCHRVWGSFWGRLKGAGQRWLNFSFVALMKVIY